VQWSKRTEHRVWNGVYFLQPARAHYGYSISLPCCSGAAVGRLGLVLRLGLTISVEYSQCALLARVGICALPSRIKCRPYGTAVRLLSDDRQVGRR